MLGTRIGPVFPMVFPMVGSVRTGSLWYRGAAGCVKRRRGASGVLRRRGPCSPRVALALSVGAFLCLATAAASAEANLAASADALLSNLDEGNDLGLAVGTPADNPSVEVTQAIQFQTGSNERGYNLTSVKAVLANAAASDGVRVRIFGARSIGTPYISFYTLINPVIADGTLTFAAPASATLRKDAGYFVVFDSTASDAGNDYEIRGTESDSLNSQADGWSLSEDRHSTNKDSASWTTASAIPLIEINGDVVVKATDANLRALRMRDGNGKLLTYSPFFDSSITSYATSSSPKVDRITILGTASNDDGATVAYLDEDDQLLTDADAVKDGFQVDLEVGANTINVRVTAEDGSTTRTYTMVVTRPESRVSPDALASNLDEHFSKRLYVGNLEPGKILRAQALGFETGDNELGYVLTSVKILIWEITHSAGVRVRVFSSTADGNPGSSLYTLSGEVVLPTNPDVPAGEESPASTFEAPANATLESNTGYFVVLDSSSSELYRFYKIFGTKSDDISKVADGWSMNDYRHTGIRGTGVWTTADDVPFVEVAGHAIVPSSDATLSDFALTWDDAGTESAIALNPAFSATTTDYTASVASGVDRITIDGTRSDDDATVLYLDGTDSTLTDADGNATGFQVDLDLGVNTIKVKVTAPDGETTEVYTVTVARGAVAPLLSTTMTVGGDSTGVGFSSLPNPDVGALEDDTFEHAGLTRRVQIVAASSDGVTFRTRNGGNTFGGLVLEWAGEVLPLDDASRSSNTFTWNQTWLDANASALNAANYETTLPTGDTTPVCLRDERQSCSSAFVVPSVSNQEPEFDDGTGAARSVAENATVGMAVGAPVSATDDDGDALTYDLAGTDAAGFSIEGSTGQLRTAAVLDHEAGASRSVTVSVSDGNGGSATIPVTVAVTDVDEPPDAPTAPTVTGASSSSLSVSWSAPANAGRPALTDYDLQYRAGATGAFTDWAHTGTATSATITGLSTDTAYQVQVLARNAEGTSGWSPTGEGRTEADDATLTAWFEDVPTAHDGTAEFTLTLKFSARVSTLVRHLRHQRLVLTSGTVTGMRRVDRTAEGAAEFTLRITPTGTDAVTVSLPADGTACDAGGVCTADGVQLSEGAEATVPGPAPEAEGDVRLAGGTTAQEGRLEIRHDGAWGTVCDDRFTSDDAAVVCRQLGYAGGEAHRRAAFGAGTGTIWLDDVDCSGNELRLTDCPFVGWGLHNCSHSEDVGVSCGSASGMTLANATVSGSALRLRFHRDLDGSSVPSPGDFVVAAGSTATAVAIPVESVAVIDGEAILSPARAVGPAEKVSFSYLPAPMHPLQDVSYNPVPPFTGQPASHVARPDRDDVAARDIVRSSPRPETGSWSAAKVDVLDLSASGLSDVSSLAGLGDVEVLDLGGNGFDDLWPLAAMAGLEVLDLRDNAVSDLSPLAGLTDLRVLDLSGNAVSDISPLAGLTALRRLDLSGNRVVDLGPLSELRRLEVLLLDGNRVSDLVWLWGLQELAHLDLGNNRVADGALLREARSLRRLDLGGNALRDVSVLGDLPKLVWLRVSGSLIADFSVLGRLTALHWLVLDAGASRTDVARRRNGDQVPLLLIGTTAGKEPGAP